MPNGKDRFNLDCKVNQRTVIWLHNECYFSGFYFSVLVASLQRWGFSSQLKVTKNMTGSARHLCILALNICRLRLSLKISA